VNLLNRNKYSASAVKFALWFMGFRKEVQLLSQGKSFDDIKTLSEAENIFGASTPARAAMIQSTLTARIQNMHPSFYGCLWIATLQHKNYMHSRDALLMTPCSLILCMRW